MAYKWLLLTPRDPGSPNLRMVSWNLNIMRFEGDWTSQSSSENITGCLGLPSSKLLCLFPKRRKTIDQWLFLVPLKGGRWHIIPQLAVYTTCSYTTYILPSGGLHNPYHLLGEPETTIELM